MDVVKPDTEGSKAYWKSLEDRRAGSEHAASDAPSDAKAVVESLTTLTNRRDFLKLAGFSLAALTGCSRTPVEHALPYLVGTEEITPGRAYFYASTCGACAAGCGVLIKNKDGRPIKLEGNPSHPVNRGGLCAIGQASLLGLYDSRRFRGPRHQGREISWAETDSAIVGRLERIRSGGGAVRLLTGTLNSPTLRHAVARFLETFDDGRHVAYDAFSSSAILDAHARTHGQRVLPHYRFDRAEAIVSFDADFLGTWISPVEFTAGYVAARDLTGTPLRYSWHAQIESILSLTGSKADERISVAPHMSARMLAALAARIEQLAGSPVASAPADVGELRDVVERLATRLWAARGKSLIVCGSQDVAIQQLCNLANERLGNYGHTIDLERPSLQRSGDDAALGTLLDELEEHRVEALIVAGVNPVYDLAWVHGLEDALRAVPLLISVAEREDETSRLAEFVCPDRHFLESWTDAEPISGVICAGQPVVQALGDTRQFVETLLAWTGTGGTAYDAMRGVWESEIFPRRADPVGEEAFSSFWSRALHDGIVTTNIAAASESAFVAPALDTVVAQQTSADSELTLVVYPKVAMRDGRHAYNAWLQELPDPISKVTWDNYACLSPATVRRLGLRDGDVVRITAAGARTIQLPVFAQPGQHDAVVAVAAGYGGLATERFAQLGPKWLQARPTVGPHGRVGVQVSGFLAFDGNTVRYSVPGITLARTSARRPLASTQSHHSIDVPEGMAPPGASRRPIVQETTLALLSSQPPSGAPQSRGHGDAGLWPVDHEYRGPRWGMIIDLNSCTGCSACVTACQVENNIPVVGRDEVLRQREMHWIRIDRYYSGDEDAVDVVHQPMMCQHCGNAPCEVVCPVLATVHSEEGLNQQVYNRCIGTRYCANNCPYKVRRFNWFDYPHEEAIQKLVLNPDVVVRSRGVMEKCSMCVQRIQEAKIESRRLGEDVRDGDIQTACQQSCPARAITFGDLNNPDSAASRLAAGSRHFQVLEELNVRPGVGYLSVVRNR